MWRSLNEYCALVDLHLERDQGIDITAITYLKRETDIDMFMEEQYDSGAPAYKTARAIADWLPGTDE